MTIDNAGRNLDNAGRSNDNASRSIDNAGWILDNSYARLPKVFYSRVSPAPVKSPTLVVLNEPLAVSLGLDPQALRSDEGLAVLAGNLKPEGSMPLAQAYGGHQFGYFTMLGDGRAMLLGEQLTLQGDRVDVQLKGSGRTPYSRGGDGRAALGPMLREYIISEAMHALGIPTTRSLAVVATGESVRRESEQPGAVLTRIAASHLRVGTFEYAVRWGTADDLRELTDYTIQRHYPEVANAGVKHDPNKYLHLLGAVISRQAKLIAMWQSVGFIHGVMNTDNMALSGETIDYGPCAFMDIYDVETVFSSIDVRGRYAYGNQPSIASWNLARFAESLLPLLHADRTKAIELAQGAISDFSDLFVREWLVRMRAKLGIFAEGPDVGDKILIDDLLSLMQRNRADYTNTFRALTLGRLDGDHLFTDADFQNWHKRWHNRKGCTGDASSASELMKKNNPAIIPRNHRVEEALKAAVECNDYSVMESLIRVTACPYAYSDEQENYAKLGAPNPAYKTFCGT